MTRLQFRDAHQRYTRISKRDARKRWDAGDSLYVIAAKMRPGFPFSMGMMVFPSEYKNEGRDFDYMVSNFAWYNCTHETGYYPAFYVVSEVN